MPRTSKKTCKPGEVLCRGCRKCRRHDPMGEICDVGRRPTIARCGDCIWATLLGMCKPDKVADLKKLLVTPPGVTGGDNIEQETFNYDNDR